MQSSQQAVPNFVEQEDSEVWSAIAAEQTRQAEGLEMIASENFTSPAVMQAVGSVLTNKYAEGYPGRRYYGGCEFVDKVEDLARDRLKALFGAEHANVQPHSGSQANAAVYLASLQAGDTVLAFDLAHGGHLTHGMKLNSSGILYNFVHYGVRQDDHLLDFDQVARLAREHKPKMIVAGAMPIRGRFRTARSPRLPARLARSCLSIWPTTPALWRPASTTIPWPWPTSSRAPRTRRSAARVVAWRCVVRPMPRHSTAPSSPALRVAR